MCCALPVVCFLATLAAIFAGLPALASDPPPKVRDTLNARLFPMKVGAKWVYASGDKEVAFEALRTEKAGDTEVFVVRRTIDKAAVDFRVSVEDDGVYIHKEGEKEFSPPLRQFAFFARTGDTWKWRGTYGGKKRRDVFEHLGVREVTVPAGTYTALAVERSEPDTGDHTTFWLARDVGVVKLSGKTELSDDPNAGKVVFEWNLKSYMPGDK